MTETATPEGVLKQYWGYDTFRPNQREVIGTVLEGRDALVIMPTGGGKSLCYQVPGMLKPGITLVVSPLIALMKDQVEQLTKRGIKAHAVFSGLSYSEMDTLLDNAVYGDIKFLYVSPERLETDLFRERARRMPVNLIAVDEAHCISQWGHQFRPSYRNIQTLRELMPEVPMVALTASATPEVQKDIAENLGLKDPVQFTGSFRRPNISMVTRKVENKPVKLMEVLSKLGGSGILYVRSRKKTAELSDLLNQNGYASTYYHAGLHPAERNRRQQAWMTGEIPVIVCTNAFGMGIDRAAVRFVIHWDLPESLEAYYQEAGRAGRDGKMSYAVLLYNQQGLGKLKANLTRQFPALKEIKATYNALCNHLQVATGSGFMMSYDFDLQKFTRMFHLEMVKTYNILRILEQEGYILMSESVHLPSRVKFIMSKKDIYKFQVEHQKWDKLIQALLRTYGGIIDDYTIISESYLGDRLKMPEEQLKKDLLYLKKQGVINYVPYKENPSLTFLKNRVADPSLVIDRAFWETRKKVTTLQVRAMMNFTTGEDQCKQVVLSRYFGEANDDPCGKCSVCIAGIAGGRRAYRAMKDRLVSDLQGRDSLPLEDFLEGMGHHERQEAIEFVRRAVEAGEFTMDDHKNIGTNK